MAYEQILVNDAHLTSYDEDYPTRSTENLNWNLHSMLMDMQDAGPWWLNDNNPDTTDCNTIRQAIYDNIKVVFDYAALAITTYRATGTPAIAEPAVGALGRPVLRVYEAAQGVQWQIQALCFQKMYMIYYLWKTEDDPLLIKEYMRDLLNSWPLMDTTIQLSDETGQSFRVFPAWNNIESP